MNIRATKVFGIATTFGMLALGGCAGYAPSKEFIGLSRSETIVALGQPNPVPVDVDSAGRLDFPRGPFGKHTYAVYFDESGKAISYRQLLTDENFAKISTGMDEAEVINLIGISKDTFKLGRDRGYVWNYRYVTPLCRWFQIEFSAERKVRSAGYAIPPECRIGTRAIR